MTAEEWGEPDVAVPARALGDPARGRIAAALMGGRAFPAGELAQIAGVSASTASEHLRILIEANIVTFTPQGRNRYYQLANADVARAMEALQAIAPRSEIRSFRQHRVSKALRAGRTCYDHLAGDLGLRITDLLVAEGAVEPLTAGAAYAVLEPFPEDPLAQALSLQPPRGRRPWARGCLDWTGRRPHVAGQLGDQVCASMLTQGWIIRSKTSRAVRLRDEGERALCELEQG